MMDVKVPELPESVDEATLMTWHKHAGDTVARDEKLADIETDKVVLEVSAAQAGVLKKIVAQEGQVLRRGDVIAVIDPGAAEAGEPARKEPAPQAEHRPSPMGNTAETAAKTPDAVQAAPSSPAASTAIREDLSPAVRKLVAQHNLSPDDISGTGRGGRITKADVVRFIESSPGVTARIGAPEQPSPVAVEAPRDTAPGEHRVPMSRIRARIAERLIEAQQTAAMLTTFNEVNMRPVMNLRGKHKEAFEKNHGVKLGFMSFFVKACVEALKKYPVINASMDGTDILYHEYFDIGIAVSAPRGLVVPILRNADELSFAEVEGRIQDYGKRAQQSQLTIEDLKGGTFTISNGGVFGSLLSTPILNPPQSAILGMHRIQERPVAENGEVVIRPMMYLALTYDHRIVDGREAVLFLVTIKDLLEDPARMMLQV